MEILSRRIVSQGIRGFTAPVSRISYLPSSQFSKPSVAKSSFNQFQQIRGFVGPNRFTNVSRRPVAVQEQEQEQQKKYETRVVPRESRQFQPQQQRPDDSLESNEGAIGGIKNHLKKVYTTLTAGVGLIGAGAYGAYASGLTAYLATLSPWVYIPAVLVPALGSMYWMYKTPIENATTKVATFSAFSLVMGATLGHLVPLPMSILGPAAMGTLAIFGAFTAASFIVPEKYITKLGVPLGAGLFGIMIAGLIGSLMGFPIASNISLYGGLIIFPLYITYDTQQIVEKFQEGDRDYVNHSVDLILDLINIFTRLVRLLTRSDD